MEFITDNIEFFLYDRSNKNDGFVKLEFAKIIKKLTNLKEIRVNKNAREQVLKYILNAANKHLSDNKEFQIFIRSKSLLSQIKFDSKSNF